MKKFNINNKKSQIIKLKSYLEGQLAINIDSATTIFKNLNKFFQIEIIKLKVIPNLSIKQVLMNHITLKSSNSYFKRIKCFFCSGAYK